MNERYLRTADGRSRREAAIPDHLLLHAPARATACCGGSATAFASPGLSVACARRDALKRDSVRDEDFDVAGRNEVFGDVYGSRRRAQRVPQ
jgi:hypothetical protein